MWRSTPLALFPPSPPRLRSCSSPILYSSVPLSIGERCHMLVSFCSKWKVITKPICTFSAGIISSTWWSRPWWMKSQGQFCCSTLRGLITPRLFPWLSSLERIPKQKRWDLHTSQEVLINWSTPALMTMLFKCWKKIWTNMAWQTPFLIKGSFPYLFLMSLRCLFEEGHCFEGKWWEAAITLL